MDTTSIEVAALRALAWADRRLQEKSTIVGICGWLGTIGFASFGGEISAHADTITALAGMLSTALVTTSTKPRQPELPLTAPVVIPSVTAEAVADPAKASPVTSMENTEMKIIAELEDDAVAVLKAAGKIVVPFVLTEGQKLVAEVKQTYVGTVAMNVVSALENQQMDGSEKLATVVAAVVPLITKLVASGGVSGAIASVESFALEFAQSVYNDFKADAAAVIAKAA